MIEMDMEVRLVFIDGPPEKTSKYVCWLNDGEVKIDLITKDNIVDFYNDDNGDLFNADGDQVIAWLPVEEIEIDDY